MAGYQSVLEADRELCQELSRTTSINSVMMNGHYWRLQNCKPVTKGVLKLDRTRIMDE